MLYPQNIEQKIDFQIIRDGLKGCCMSTLGKEQVDAMRWLTRYGLVRELLSRVREMMGVLTDPALTFPQGEIYDLREALSRIRIEGLFMDEAELHSLRKLLDYAGQLERFFTTLDKGKYPLLSQDAGVGRLNSLESRVDSRESNIGFLIASIDRIIDRYGKMRDNASPELARLRKEISASQGSVSRALNAILRQAQAEGILDKDAAPTMREGRLVLPVPPAYKRKIGGIVHDESATGKTVFIEPQQVVEANNRIRELEGEERRERIRILMAITAEIRPQVPQILETETYLGEVDFLRAKALFALDMHAIVPEVNDRPMIDWREAYHPVLLLNFRRQGKTVVPLTIRLLGDEARGDEAKGERILVISGPNAGGKSVCLKTVALLQYMMQCGLAVPMSEASQMGFFKQLLIDIGDEQSIEDDLSTYSSHLRNMKHFVRYADAQTLLLIDEFGTGTEPLIGGAIAEAVLAALNERHAFGVITTHYGNLKHFAERTEGIVNGAMLYDRGQLKPLFQLSIGQAGSSFAVEIARQIGLPETIIQRATDIVGEEHIDYDKHLQDIARDKRYWENKRQNIRQKEKHLEEKIAHYEEQMAGIKAKKRAILEEANAEAADLLRKSNATIERTIREIKEAKAEKQATQAARHKVETLKTRVEKKGDKAIRREGDEAKGERRKARGEKQKNVLRDLSELKVLTKNPAKLIQEQGAKSQEQRRVSNVADELRRRKLSFSRELDIRGLRVDEALETLIAYVDDALMVNAEQVTILHGTGTGALKQVVRDYLAERQKSMRRLKTGDISFHDGDPDRGGAGITVVEL